MASVSPSYRLELGGRTLKLSPGSHDVGRGADCWLTLNDDQISRQHARFHVTGEGVVLEDLDSRNGTFVNDRQVRGSVDLSDGDEIRMGKERMRLNVEKSLTEDTVDQLRRTIGPSEQSQFPSLIGQLIEKSLSMGKVKEAERYALALTNQLAGTRGSMAVDNPTAVSGIRCLTTLAEKSAKGEWVDRLFKIHVANRWIMQDEVLEQIRGALDRIPRIPGSGLGEYERLLRQLSREGQEVSPRLMAAIGELSDTYA